MESIIKIFSFFAGAGFLDLGFEHEDANICYVNENHAPFMDAYKHSRKKLGLKPPTYGYEPGSIESLLHSKKFSQQVSDEIDSGNIVGFIGGPPCPDFSVGGKNRGRDGDNGKLSKVYIDLICTHKPHFFLFENVKGLYRTKKHRDFFESLKRKLKKNGYVLDERLINSIEYGAPQDRDRIILVGFRRGLDLPRKMTWTGQVHSDRTAFQRNWPTTDEFGEGNKLDRPNGLIESLTVEHWFQKNDVLNHPNAKHCFTPRNGLAKFLTIKEGDDSKKSYKRLHRWRYSPTAAYGNNEVHLHPYKARRISAAEALAIQSLPKEFELPNDMTLTNMFKAIGNGVPYLAARGLAKSIIQHLEGSHESNSKQHNKCDQPSAA